MDSGHARTCSRKRASRPDLPGRPSGQLERKPPGATPIRRAGTLAGPRASAAIGTDIRLNHQATSLCMPLSEARPGTIGGTISAKRTNGLSVTLLHSNLPVKRHVASARAAGRCCCESHGSGCCPLPLYRADPRHHRECRLTAVSLMREFTVFRVVSSGRPAYCIDIVLRGGGASVMSVDPGGDAAPSATHGTKSRGRVSTVVVSSMGCRAGASLARLAAPSADDA